MAAFGVNQLPADLKKNYRIGISLSNLLGRQGSNFRAGAGLTKKELARAGNRKQRARDDENYRSRCQANPQAGLLARLRQHSFYRVPTHGAATRRREGCRTGKSVAGRRNRGACFGKPGGANRPGCGRRIEIELELRTGSAELDHVAGRKPGRALNAALVDKGSVAAVEIRNFDFGRFGSFHFNAGVLTADKVVAVGIVANIAGGVPPDSKLAEMVEREFLNLVFTAGAGVPHDNSGIQGRPLLCGICKSILANEKSNGGAVSTGSLQDGCVRAMMRKTHAGL